MTDPSHTDKAPETTEYLALKWGTLKGWDLKSEASKAAARKYAEGGMSMNAMAQADSPEQKLALCELIDAVNGSITNDWSGKEMTKEEAKKYVLEYRA